MSLDKHLIDRTQSKILKTGYLSTNYRNINSARPADKPDSRMYTFDLEVMQDYINLIRDEMDRYGVKNQGIRITMGKYPDSDFSGMNPKYAGYQTVVISAVDLDAGMQRDFADAEVADVNIDEESLEIPEMNFANITPPYY